MSAPTIEAALNPSHYKDNKIAGRECIELTRHMTFAAGNAVKYIWRAGQKPGEGELKDLRKALWYLNDLRDGYNRMWHSRNPDWFPLWMMQAAAEDKNPLLTEVLRQMHFAFFGAAHLMLELHIADLENTPKEIPNV